MERLWWYLYIKNEQKPLPEQTSRYQNHRGTFFDQICVNQIPPLMNPGAIEAFFYDHISVLDSC